EKELKSREVAGECEWNLHKKMASVRILDPIDYPDDLMTDHDMEWTLVHELLHLHFAPIGRDSDENQEILIEQAIDSIAWVIVNLTRQNKELKEGLKKPTKENPPNPAAVKGLLRWLTLSNAKASKPRAQRRLRHRLAVKNMVLKRWRTWPPLAVKGGDDHGNGNWTWRKQAQV